MPNSEPSTALYQEVCEAVLGTDDCTYGMHYHSCDRGVAAAVRWTGADINFPAGACDSQYTYLKESPLWEEVTHGDVPIGGDDDWAASIGLEPGDVGVSYGEHTLAYVGNEAVLAGYENFIKGNDGQVPGTGGDIGEPTPGSAWVMASYGERGAGIQNMSDSRPYAFFRYVGDYPDADKYSNVGTSATINGTTSHGTSCDCGEEPEECNNSGYKGRVGIFELLLVSPAIQSLVNERKPTQFIKEQAMKEGMVTMRQDGIKQILDGITTSKEVLQYTM